MLNRSPFDSSCGSVASVRSRGVPRRVVSTVRSTSAGLGGAIAADRSSVKVRTVPSATPHWASVRSSGSGWWPGGATV